MNRFPSFIEHAGMYNVLPHEYRGDDISPDDDSTSYHFSEPTVPSLIGRECQAMSNLAYSCLHEHGKPPGFTEQEVRQYYIFCVGDAPADRTLRIELPDVRLLTPEFVRGFQRDVLLHHPLWRVMIVNGAPETIVMIYPNIVRVGSAAVGENWSSTLRQAAEREWVLREPRDGPHRRQVKHLKSILSDYLKTMTPKSCCVIAVFDNSNGDHQYLSVWIAHHGVNSEDFQVEKPREVMVGDVRPVKETGDFGKHYHVENGQGRFWIREWVLPADYRGELEIQRFEDYQPITGDVRNVAVHNFPIIPDERLKTTDRELVNEITQIHSF